MGKQLSKEVAVMQLSMEFWIQIIIYGVTLGTVFGSFKTKLSYLEKKMDKHNNLIERMACVERDCASAHRRIDEVRGG